MSTETINSALTEALLASWILENSIEDDDEKTNAINWLMTLANNSEVSLSDALTALVIDSKFTIDALVTMLSSASTEEARIAALKTLMNGSSGFSNSMIVNAYLEYFKVIKPVEYERFFKYITVVLKDPSVFLLNEQSTSLKSLSLVESSTSRKIAYNEIKAIYSSNIAYTSLSEAINLFTTDANAFLSAINVSRLAETSALGWVSWADELKTSLMLSCPLISDPSLNSLQENLWGNDTPLGYMYRGIYKGSYKYNGLLFIKTLSSLASFVSANAGTLALEEISTLYEAKDYSAIRAVTDPFIVRYYETESNMATSFYASLRSSELSRDEKIALDGLFAEMNNRECIQTQFITDFSYFGLLLIVEEILPELVSGMAKGNIITGFIESLDSDSDVLTTELEKYTTLVVAAHNLSSSEVSYG